MFYGVSEEISLKIKANFDWNITNSHENKPFVDFPLGLDFFNLNAHFRFCKHRFVDVETLVVFVMGQTPSNGVFFDHFSFLIVMLLFLVLHVLFLLVPPPLVDLRLRQSSLIRHFYYFLFIPVGFSWQLRFQDLYLVCILPFPLPEVEVVLILVLFIFIKRVIARVFVLVRHFAFRKHVRTVFLLHDLELEVIAELEGRVRGFDGVDWEQLMEQIFVGSGRGLQDLQFGGPVVVRYDAGQGRQFFEFGIWLLLGGYQVFLHVQF